MMLLWIPLQYNKTNDITIYVVNVVNAYNSGSASGDSTRNKYHFRMIDADCNLQLQTVFDRLPKA